jgi:hypothetical protein
MKSMAVKGSTAEIPIYLAASKNTLISLASITALPVYGRLNGLYRWSRCYLPAG